MFTAEEARKLAGPTLQERVDALCEAIRSLASEKKRICRTDRDYGADLDLWIHGGYTQTDEWKEACKILTDAGYKVSFYYAEHQFVDMYTLVEW